MLMRWTPALLVVPALLALRQVAGASPGDPLSGDDAGCIPPTVTVGKCEDGVAKALTKYSRTVITCHIKAADAGVTGGTFPEELCESDPTTGRGAKEKYDAAVAKLALTCPSCSTANASALRSLVEMTLECHNGD